MIVYEHFAICVAQVRTYLTYANIVAPLAFNHRRIVVDVQDVDGQRVVGVSGRRTIVNGAHL